MRFWTRLLRCKLGLIAFGGAALTLSAGTISIPASETPMDAGYYAGGSVLSISITGTVSLNGAEYMVMNPDGSLAVQHAVNCAVCWYPGYQYFLPDAAAPNLAGGDGLNHFVGGGGNYDMYGFPDGWASVGKKTTDTTDPLAIRFGAVAGTWSDHPVDNSTDWFLVGYGGTFTAPAGGAHLRLMVVDTYYANDTGSFNVNINEAPEPAVSWLVFTGILTLGFSRCRRRARKA
jgi:hypothetical protein